ncbi:MAG: hypothetical protein ABI824_06345 [Acidobacteriota bacterium]
MFASRFLHSKGHQLIGALFLTTALAIPSLGGTKLQLASVAPELLTTGGPQRAEPSTRHIFEFEIDKETGRARVVIDYVYPGAPLFGSDESAGAAPILAQIPGLRYDASSKSVVYETSGTRTVCAKVQDRRFLFWKTEAIVPTGACTVSAQLVSRTEDTGWKLRTLRTIDTFFVVD